MATGSLGQGLGVAAGMAYCGKYYDKARCVVCVCVCVCVWCVMCDVCLRLCVCVCGERERERGMPLKLKVACPDLVACDKDLMNMIIVNSYFLFLPVEGPFLFNWKEASEVCDLISGTLHAKSLPMHLLCGD